MCGILCLVRSSGADRASTDAISAGTCLVRHRGPDDEGYLLWRSGEEPCVYAGPETSNASREMYGLRDLPGDAAWRVAFGHRRLSIVDLSPAGYQPMRHRPSGLSVIFNGEIYNHVELRRDLEQRGHSFSSHSDTEVILAAWAEWGPECLQSFNGMFSFALLDPRGAGTLHVVRDRFGVKPLYWGRVQNLLAFASEIKQIRALPGFVPRLDRATVREYLASGLLDYSSFTFDEGVRQLEGGQRAVIRLDAPDPVVEILRWYELRPRTCTASLVDAAAELRALLADSVRLRLRADVPVGSCLSGGLDSSAIVCLASQSLSGVVAHEGQVTVTARFRDSRYDEWRFAEEVVRRTGATSVEVWPTFERLELELDRQLWHMDEPFGSTSQFSQWCVFAAAADAGLKVMLDGQGSDEQLAGYSGNDASLLTGLLKRRALLRFSREIISFRQEHGVLPIAQIILALRTAVARADAVLPARFRTTAKDENWLRLEESSRLPAGMPGDLNESLIRQTLSTSLPVLLRYEDRNSMARSIESRVPFLDYRLVEFLAGLPDWMKLRRGWTKVVFREAMRGVIPEGVRTRRDKMGFVTPEEIWLMKTAPDWFRTEIKSAVYTTPEFYDADRVFRMLEGMITGSEPFSFLLWRILCLGRWVRAIEGHVDTLPATQSLAAAS